MKPGRGTILKDSYRFWSVFSYHRTDRKGPKIDNLIKTRVAILKDNKWEVFQIIEFLISRVIGGIFRVHHLLSHQKS